MTPKELSSEISRLPKGAPFTAELQVALGESEPEVSMMLNTSTRRTIGSCGQRVTKARSARKLFAFSWADRLWSPLLPIEGAWQTADLVGFKGPRFVWM